MSKEAQRVYLTTRMTNYLSQFGFPIAMPNQPFDIPKNAVYGEFHVIDGPRPIIVGGEGRGRVRVRYVGFVQLTVWIPQDTGTKDGTQAEDKFRDIFQLHQGRDTAGSQYKFGALQAFTPQTKKGYECVVVRVPFERDSVEQVTITTNG